MGLGVRETSRSFDTGQEGGDCSKISQTFSIDQDPILHRVQKHTKNRIKCVVSQASKLFISWRSRSVRGLWPEAFLGQGKHTMMIGVFGNR